VLSLVHSQVIDQAGKLSRNFQGNTPFRHVVVDGFLGSAFLEQLRAEFPPFDPKQALNEFGEVGRKAVVQDVTRLGPSYQKFDKLIRCREFLSLVEKITGIPKLLYDPDYAGGGTHENRDGQDLDPHIDFNYHPRKNLHRRLNLILFLNPEWDPAWGGALELHEDPWLASAENHVTTIGPLENRCVIFETSEHSWHGFPAINLPEDKKHMSRRSIAVYFYTKQRPPQEIARPHATVYVQRQLPEHIRSGHKLEEEDLKTIQTLLGRRDKQIQFLYERELKFSSTIERIVNSPSHRAGRFLTWPLRKIAALINFRRSP